MSITLKEIITIVDRLWPQSLAQGWDSVGLVVGEVGNKIEKILFAVDPVDSVVDEAILENCQLIITHHPLFLKGVTSVAATSSKGALVHKLIKNNIALLTVHTNGDSVFPGVSDALMNIFGLKETRPLELLSDSFGEFEQVGLGRVGVLPEAMLLQDFSLQLLERIPKTVGGIKIAGDPSFLVKKVAMCGGSGDSLFDEVVFAQADVYVTADLKHHAALEFRQRVGFGKIALIDVSHWASEWVWLSLAAELLEKEIFSLGYKIFAKLSLFSTDPWDFSLKYDKKGNIV